MKSTESLKTSFMVGQVRIEPLLQNIHNVQVDGIVQAGSAVDDVNEIHAASWVWEADDNNSIFNALIKHSPFRLGDVIVTCAGSLKAKYLLSAIVIDRIQLDASQKPLNDQVICDTARKCIAIASALGLRSIAFTAWGTRTTTTQPAHVTALMLQGITQALEDEAGQLEVVYLVSNNKTHYQWFVDRSFVFGMFLNQIEQARQAVESLNIPNEQKQNVERILNNITHNIVVYNQTTFGDSLRGDKILGDKADGDKVLGDKKG
jgi:O-acetyl-ADP-ribose deacetylase (regulator of RNase III)